MNSLDLYDLDKMYDSAGIPCFVIAIMPVAIFLGVCWGVLLKYLIDLFDRERRSEWLTVSDIFKKFMRALPNVVVNYFVYLAISLPCVFAIYTTYYLFVTPSLIRVESEYNILPARIALYFIVIRIIFDLFKKNTLSEKKLLFAQYGYYSFFLGVSITLTIIKEDLLVSSAIINWAIFFIIDDFFIIRDYVEKYKLEKPIFMHKLRVLSVNVILIMSYLIFLFESGMVSEVYYNVTSHLYGEEISMLILVGLAIVGPAIILTRIYRLSSAEQ